MLVLTILVLTLMATLLIGLARFAIQALASEGAATRLGRAYLDGEADPRDREPAGTTVQARRRGPQ